MRYGFARRFGVADDGGKAVLHGLKLVLVPYPAADAHAFGLAGFEAVDFGVQRGELFAGQLDVAVLRAEYFVQTGDAAYRAGSGLSDALHGCRLLLRPFLRRLRRTRHRFGMAAGGCGGFVVGDFRRFTHCRALP